MGAEKLFWKDPYLTMATAMVTGVLDSVVTLDRTILFAFSGGQQSDEGTIGGFPVEKSEKLGLEIEYTLPVGHTLHTGDEVVLTLDWEKRFRIMRLHFAAELVLELVYQNYSRPEKIGANVTYDKARVDFFFDGNIADALPDIHRTLSQMIADNFEIISSFSDEPAEKRTWEIKGFAKVPCGGTHPRRTGEIGAVRLKRENPGKGKERIEIYLED